MDIREAAASLADHVAPHRDANHWLITVGVGAGEILVYVTAKMWLDHIPAEWQGFPVKAKATGRPRMC